MRMPRIKHLRRALKNLTGTRLRKLKAWTDYIAANLNGTGTSQNFTVVPASVAATGTLTLTGNAANSEVVIIGDRTYTFEDVLTNVNGHVKVGASASASLDNLIAAINLGTRQIAATGTLTVGTNPADHVKATGTLTLAGNAVDHAKATGILTLAGNVVDHAKATGVLTLTGNAQGTAATGTLTLTGNILDAVKAIGTLTLTGNAVDAVAATGTLTFALNAAQNEQVTIDGVTYEFTALVNSTYDVLIEALASDTIDNLIAAINHGAGEGTKYGTGTVVHPTVTAAAGAGDTMNVTAKTAGTGGNSLATTETMGNGSWGGGTLSGGLAAETCTIGATVYPFKDTLGTAFDVKIGATASDTIDNLIAAIMHTAGEGSTYGTGTTEHSTVTAAVGAGDTMDVAAKTAGTAGNSIASTETMSNGSWGDVTLLTGKNTETVTIDAVTYSFATTLVDSANNVKIGVSASATLDNLIAAINHAAGEGSTYGTGTVVHPTVTAVAGAGDTMDVTAKTGGTGGNSIVSTDATDNGSWGGGTLGGGVALETVTIDATTYTFQDTLVDSPNYVLIGASANDTIDNLVAAIMHAAGEGTTYGTGTVAHATVSAAAGAGDTMDATANDFGAAGNSLATTLVMANGAWGGVTLTGGLDYETVTIGTRTYTLQGVLVDAANNVLIGVSASATIDNLIAAITAGVGEGSTYGTGTVEHTVVTAAAGAGDTMDVTAKNFGTAGNVASTETMSAGSFGGVALTGGLEYETVTIGTRTYTLQGVLVDAANNVLIGASASDTIDNLILAITAGAGAGTNYGTGTTEHAVVTAAAGAGDTMTVTAKNFGVAGNVASTETMSAGSFGGANLTGGLDYETVTIGTTTYTFQPTLTNSANNVLVGAGASATLDNLIAAINAAAGAGTLYGTGTVANASVTAAAGAGDTVTLTAKTLGLGGNSVATTETLVNGSFGDATLTGGIDYYAAAMTVNAEVGAADGAGDTMTVTADDVGLDGNTIDTTTTLGSGSWGAVTLENGDNADRLDIVGHSYTNGKGPFSLSSDDTLPDGLSATSLYWVYRIDDDHISLHVTQADALAGVHAVDILDTGTGTHSLAPATTAQAVIEHLRQGVSTARLQAATDVDDLI